MDDPVRKWTCERSLRYFCECYLSGWFHMAWSPDHLLAIHLIEKVVRGGGFHVLGMPRGFGKTRLALAAALWSALYGHRRCVLLVGAGLSAAQEMFDALRLNLENNPLLQADFPEVCQPIQALEGIAQRRLLYHGAPIRMSMKNGQIILPDIEGSQAASNIVKLSSIAGRVRGMNISTPDGRSVRPSLVIPDDLDNDVSARSPGQLATRRNFLDAGIKGMAEPGVSLGVIMPCTVIAETGVAAEYLDRKKHPECSGSRRKLMYSMPTAERLWEQYADAYRDAADPDAGRRDCTALYRANQAEMDAGAIVAWPQFFEPWQASAVQCAMHLKLFSERAFFAEYQNEPLPEIVADSSELTADQIAARVNRSPRATVPAGSTQLTAFIDVQWSALFYTVAAWESAFTGALIDYGAWPDQQRSYWTLRDAKRTLLTETKAGGLEASIYAGLDALTGAILARDWPTAGGGTQRVARCLIDANWGDSTPVVYRFCRQSVHGAVLLPSHGKGIGASGTPMHDWQKNEGETRGLNWRIRQSQERGLRFVIYDTNFWKSFLVARLAVPMGSSGALTLFGETPARHRMLADHFTSEHRVTTSGRGRQVQEWKLIPGRDNHWWDCAVGCCVAASILGQSLEAHGQQGGGKRRRVSMAELRDQANQRKQA